MASIEKWLQKNINPLNFENKNVFITGGNSGIGFEVAKILASYNSNIFLLCRNTKKAETAKAEILATKNDAKIEIIQLDLASFSSIEKAVEEIKLHDVDIFINNAGIYLLDDTKTADGIELTMGTNFIGTYYLNFLLKPYFLSLNHKVKVVFETSVTSKFSSINYDDFFMSKKYSKFKIYGKSKLAINNMYFDCLDDADNKNIIYDLTHPGGTYTPLIKKAYKNKIFEFVASLFMKIAFHSPRKAALTILFALNKDYACMVGPRGLFEISGFPKEIRYKKDKNYKGCIEIAEKTIKEHKK